MARQWTHDDTIFNDIKKDGRGIQISSIMTQQGTDTFRLVQGIDIDWNDAKLPLVYTNTNTYVSDSSDLLLLIDEISHGYSISWETYKGSQQTNGDDNGDNNEESPLQQEPDE